MGAVGTISAAAHLCTERFVAMIECGLAGKIEDGRVHAEALLPVVRSAYVEPNPAIFKGVLHEQGLIATPDVRLPLLNASAASIDACLAAVTASAACGEPATGGRRATEGPSSDGHRERNPVVNGEEQRSPSRGDGEVYPAAEHFRRQQSGAFVHMTSTSGLIGNFGQANYSAAKLGVAALSKSIALDMQRFGVRSNCIAPFAWSRMTGSIPAETPEQKARVAKLQQMGPEKNAPLAVFLASDAAGWISGQVIAVDGGRS